MAYSPGSKPCLLLTVEPGPQESKTERAPSKGQPLPSNVAVSDAADKVEGSGTASSDNRLGYILLPIAIIFLLRFSVCRTQYVDLKKRSRVTCCSL